MEEKTVQFTHSEIDFLIYAINARLTTTRGFKLIEEEYLRSALKKLEDARER